MIITDPLFYLAAVPAVIIFGISKGGFGGGLGILTVPIMALVISPVQAAAITLPVLCCMDLIGLWAYRGKWNLEVLRDLIPASIIGIIIGTLLFHYLSTEFVKLMLGTISVLFTSIFWIRSWMKQRQKSAAPNRYFGWAAGVTAGFTSFIAHSGGPPIDMYLLPQRMHRTRFVATTVLLFTVMNYVKLVPYSWLGLLEMGNLLTSAALLPAAVIGFLSGIWLHKNVSERMFYNACYLFLFIVGVKLILDGLGIDFPSF